MQKYQYLLALLLLSLLAGFGWWLGPGREAPPSRQAPAHTPQYVVNGLEVLSTGENGQPEHRLRAAQLRHYDDDGSTELRDPQLTIYDPETPPWEVSSERGWVSEDGDLVRLQGEVIITRAAGPKNRPVHILTSELRVEPDREYAETDQQVEIYSNEDWVRSVGAQVWFGEALRVKFLSTVRGRYELN